MNALGYHIYAGGFTVGVSKHFKVLAHLEHKPGYGTKSCQANFPKLSIRVGPENWNLDQFDPEENHNRDVVDFLYGNPPCAAFSIIGKHKGKNDPRLTYHYQFQDLVRKTQPIVAAVESVQGMLKKGTDIVDAFEKMCEEEGYTMYIVKHDAQYLGVPQQRKRVFLIASKVELDFFKFPLTEPIPAGKVLAKVKNPGPCLFPPNEQKYKWLFKHTKPGENLADVFNRLVPPSKRKINTTGVVGGVKGRPSMVLHRVHPDFISGTMTGIARLHPKEHRYLGINEVFALCSYPKGYKVKDVNEVSRAVMPGVGEWLAKVVKAGIKKSKAPRVVKETVDVKPSYEL